MLKFIEIEDLNKTKTLVNINSIIGIDKVTHTTDINGKTLTRIWLKETHIDTDVSEYDRIYRILKSQGLILEEIVIEPKDFNIERELTF